MNLVVLPASRVICSIRDNLLPQTRNKGAAATEVFHFGLEFPKQAIFLNVKQLGFIMIHIGTGIIIILMMH